MDDAEIVATIAAGELDGLAAALDRYAASLYEYCYSIAPEAAVDAVHDTFIVAWCTLGELRDPSRLGSWLEAVAGNECFRHTLTSDGEVTSAPPAVMPPGLPGRVMSECADETPAGRALRVWVTHRAEPFGRDGFPKEHLGPRDNLVGRYLAGHRGIAVAAAAVAVLAVAGPAIALIASAGGPRHTAASAMEPATGKGSSRAATPGASLPVTPASAIPSASSQAPTSPPPSSTGAGMASQGAVSTGVPQATPPAVAMATMPPPVTTPPPPPPPAHGVIAVNPPQLVIVVKGGASATTFLLTAQNGPVAGYTITLPSGLPGTLIVSPSSGSLAAGGSARVTVTATSAVAFTADLTIGPGNIQVPVTVKVHASQHARH